MLGLKLNHVSKRGQTNVVTNVASSLPIFHGSTTMHGGICFQCNRLICHFAPNAPPESFTSPTRVLWYHRNTLYTHINLFAFTVWHALSNHIRDYTPQASVTTWWRHHMKTFSALLAICVGNSPVPGEFPTQKPVTRSFDVFFDLRPNKRLSKQSWGWWSETPSSSLWRYRNEKIARTHWLSWFLNHLNQWPYTL